MLRKEIADVEAKYLRKDVPVFRAGDTVRVHTKIKEGDKERIQLYEGVVIASSGGGARAMFTVRKVSYGVGVERIFPLHSPRIDRVEVVSRGDVRRSRLYYLRGSPGEGRPRPAGRGAEGGRRQARPGLIRVFPAVRTRSTVAPPTCSCSRSQPRVSADSRRRAGPDRACARATTWSPATARRSAASSRRCSTPTSRPTRSLRAEGRGAGGRRPRRPDARRGRRGHLAGGPGPGGALPAPALRPRASAPSSRCSRTRSRIAEVLRAAGRRPRRSATPPSSPSPPPTSRRGRLPRRSRRHLASRLRAARSRPAEARKKLEALAERDGARPRRRAGPGGDGQPARAGSSSWRRCSSPGSR